MFFQLAVWPYQNKALLILEFICFVGFLQGKASLYVAFPGALN